jgi:hypothetical protein
MNIELNATVGGRLSLSVIRKGKVIEIFKDIPNLVLNGGMTARGTPPSVGSASCSTYTSTALNYEDLPGTWSQTGNTVTRASGAGTFPSSPNQIGNELQWQDGERCHVTARASDTSITVSGPARTLTGKTIRRWLTNATATGFVQSKNAGSSTPTVDLTAGTSSSSCTVTFDSATSAYTLGSVMIGSIARIVLPVPVSIEIDDQIQFTYTITTQYNNRIQNYDLGAEASGIPTKYNISTIVGNGTNVDVTFASATHFLAGDKLDLRTIVPKRFAISSASSTSTTFTINTTAAHGLSVSASVVIEDASLAGYNGTHVVASVVDSDTITITNAANPGALGSSGTIRLSTPGTYFDDLGLATIASMVSSSVARITSAITGPAADTMSIGGDPGVDLRWTHGFSSGAIVNTPGWLSEANKKALPAVTSFLANTTGAVASTPNVETNAAAANDWTYSYFATWNAGTGSGNTRIAQIAPTGASGYINWVVTFNTPFVKTDSQRLRCTVSIQMLRTLSG